MKFQWGWGRKRSYNEKEMYRGLEVNLTVEFVSRKCRRWRGERRHFTQNKQGQSAKILRRPVSKLQVVIFAPSLRNLCLQVRLGP